MTANLAQLSSHEVARTGITQKSVPSMLRRGKMRRPQEGGGKAEFPTWSCRYETGNPVH